MRKLMFLLICSLTIIGAQAQTIIAEWSNAHGDTSDVVLLLKKDKPYMVSIPCGIGKNSNGSIWIKPIEVGKFRDALVDLKAKFEDWHTTSESNNVIDVSKDMPIKFPKTEFVWGLSTTFFAKGAFTAKWFRQGSVEFVICSVYLKAKNNQFEKELATLQFFGPQDVQNLINALSQDRINAALESKANADLFK